MAFEYSSQTPRLNFPNPLKLHNYFLAGAAVAPGVLGVLLLFSVRHALSDGSRAAAMLAALVALFMLSVAGAYLYQCLSQIRFYFGRGRPRGLAPQLGPDGEGTSPEADIVKETLRQQAIEYREPSGPIAGLLYALAPRLIYAPQPLRQFAERQFKGGVEIAALLLGLLITAVFGARDGSQVVYWISLIFFIAAIPSLLSLEPKAATPGPLQSLSVQWLIALIALAILGPVVLTLLGSSLPGPPIHIVLYNLALFLILGLVLHGLFFAAVLQQLTPPPPTAVSMVQDTWSLSNSPALITAEFLRATQEAWRDKIPNRRYVRIEPKIDLNAQSGSFRAEIIEETQPFPIRINAARTDQIAPSGAPPFVLALDIYAAVLTVLASVATYWAALKLLGGGDPPEVLALYALFGWTLGAAAFRAAARLWLRFDFESQLLWLEMSGPYVSARVEQGNVLQGVLKSSSSLVQVEGMTYRLWVANIHTACFGKDAPRHFVSLFGDPALAESLTDRLKTFAAGQASIASLGGAANAERMARNAAASGAANFGVGAVGDGAARSGVITGFGSGPEG